MVTSNEKRTYMKLVISTQIHENYGAHDWDGTGECPQYWKAKGGHEYMIEGVPLNGVDYASIVEMANIGEDNEYYRETVLDWSIESDDYMSWFEKSQLKYDGVINYKEPRIDYNELNARYEDPMAYAENAADNDAIHYGA